MSIMRSSATLVAVLAAVSAPLVSAQTWSLCDPTKVDNCPNNPAFGSSYEANFLSGESVIKDWNITNGALKYGTDGAEFIINGKGESPTIQTLKYLQFGKIEVKMKAAPGTGIISSIVLQSDNLDEVDWEFRGGFDGKVQTNYFGKGNTTTYDRMIEYDVKTPFTTSHTYAVDWTKDYIKWIIDGVTVRTLNYADANGGKNFPQTPVTVRLGIWAGGEPDGNSAGTVEWAAGAGKKTDYVGAPFVMAVESVKITNYSPGCEYKYGDKTGSYESIQVLSECSQKSSSSSSATVASSTASATSKASDASSVAGTASATKTGGSSTTGTARSVSSASGTKTGTTPVETGDNHSSPSESHEESAPSSTGSGSGPGSASGGVFAPTGSASHCSTHSTALGGSASGGACTWATETLTVTLRPGEKPPTANATTTPPGVSVTYVSSASNPTKPATSGLILTDSSFISIPSVTPTRPASGINSTTTGTGSITPSITTFPGAASRVSGMGISAIIFGMLSVLML